MEELMEEFSVTRFTERNSANGEGRTGLRTGSAGLWIKRGRIESKERMFKLRVFPDGNRPSNVGYVSIVLDLYSYQTLPFKVTLLESTILKEDFMRSFSFLQITVSAVKASGELRYSQTFTVNLAGRTIKSFFPIEMDRFVRRHDLLESSDELLAADTLTLRCEVTCIHCTIPNEKHRGNALQEYYLRELAEKESWFLYGKKSDDNYWLLDLRDISSPLCVKLREQSYFFEALFRTPCKEMDDGFLPIHESDYRVFFSLLGYVRFGNLQHIKWDADYCHLYRMANMYGMHKLQEICSEQVKRCLGKENALQTLKDADSCNDAVLRTLAFRHVLSNWKSDQLYGKSWIRRSLDMFRPELANELMCAAEILDLEEESRLCTLAARQVIQNLHRLKNSPLWTTLEKKLPDLAKVIWFFDSGVYLPAEKYQEHALEYDFYR